MAIAPSASQGEDPSCLLQLLVILGVPGLVAASLPSLPLSSHSLRPVCLHLLPFFSLIRTLSLDLGPT